jgi:hypothetical protein
MRWTVSQDGAFADSPPAYGQVTRSAALAAATAIELKGHFGSAFAVLLSGRVSTAIKV